MSVEACWTVRFGPANDGGVAVLESGRIYGGDSGYAYLGSYEVDGERVAGRLTIIRHNPQIRSIFGNAARFDLSFAVSRISDDSYRGALNAPGLPNAQLTLNRLAELP